MLKFSLMRLMLRKSDDQRKATCWRWHTACTILGLDTLICESSKPSLMSTDDVRHADASNSLVSPFLHYG